MRVVGQDEAHVIDGEGSGALAQNAEQAAQARVDGVDVTKTHGLVDPVSGARPHLHDQIDARGAHLIAS
jgi:hypothetical protein